MQQELRDIVQSSRRIVFFGGAGVSTASGIPDYRSKSGLYNRQGKRSPEEMLSHTFFMKHTQEFYDFYRSNLLHLDAQPNDAHRALAVLQQQQKLAAIVTQNVDGLHQKAGNTHVFELHGSVWRNFCMACSTSYSAYEVAHAEGVPHCDCGGIIKPDVVLYEEPLDDEVVGKAVTIIASADTLVVGGTSLAVYPAAGMLRYFAGDNLVLINQTPTSYDHHASLIIREPIDQVLREAVGL